MTDYTEIERPIEPHCINEDPEQWCEVLAWEEARANKLESKNQALRARVAELESVCGDIAPEIESEINHRYAGMIDVPHERPCTRSDYNRDMETVKLAKHVLSKSPTQSLNDIKADAIEEAAKSIVLCDKAPNDSWLDGYISAGKEFDAKLIEYANQLRQAESKS